MLATVVIIPGNTRWCADMAMSDPRVLLPIVTTLHLASVHGGVPGGSMIRILPSLLAKCCICSDQFDY